MSDWERRRWPFKPFDFEIRVSGIIGGEPFTFRLTPEGIQTKGFETVKRRVKESSVMVEEREPLVEVVGEKNHIIVMVDVPGVPKEAIEINATESMLTISAETSTRKYYKEVDLPAKVNPEKARATYNNGVLEVRLEKVERPKGERLKID